MLKKIMIDGLSFEVAETIAQAFDQLQVKNKANTDVLQARCDSAESQVKKLSADLTAASDPKKFTAAVADRLSLVQTAATHEVKCDGLDDMAVRRAVVSKIDSTLKLDGKSDEYVRAAYDLAIARNPVVDQLTQPGAPGSTVTDAAPPGPAAHRVAHAKGFFGFDPTKRLDQ